MNEIENGIKASPRRRVRRTLAAILLAILAALWLVVGPLGVILYVGGFFNSLWVWVFLFLAALPLALLVIVSVPAVLVLIPYVFVTWHRQSIQARRSLVLTLVALSSCKKITSVSFW